MEKSRTVNAMRTGNSVKVSIGGKLHNKNCGSPELANEFYLMVEAVKQNPTDEGILSLFGFLNEKTRVAMACGLETNIDTGEVYLAGFNTPVPEDLVMLIQEYHENKYPVDAIVNFWKLLMLNPDTRVRADLFGFIREHDFVLTDNGYMVVYKAVHYRAKDENDLAEFVTNQYLHVKKHWDTSPKKYIVYRSADQSLHFTKKSTFKNWDLEKKQVTKVGNLSDLFKGVDKLIEDSETVYTDMHTRKMEIKLGAPVLMPRTECDADPHNECSYGLHVGATKYVNSFANRSGAVLVCYVNPAHVVAVPEYDNSKMRVTEYFPFAMATYKDNQIDIIEEAYFESDYVTYERAELNKMIEVVLNEETPIETAKSALEENRDLDELTKIIEARIIDLN